jgi:chromosome segregation ATPase
MSFGYPNDNSHFDNHNVSEESFWPSFTDIMMVIVMVFLLVAVSVILNNYQLVENLKKSMQAQQLASLIAEDAQVENNSLETHLLQLKQQLARINDQMVGIKVETDNNQTELLKNQQVINELHAISAQQTQQLDEKTSYLATLEEKSKHQLKAKALEIAEFKIAQQTLEETLNRSKEKIATQQQVFSQLQQKEEDSEDKVVALQGQIVALKTQHKSDESKLLSLHGELDSLDKKYQKLLRPARSTKGKYIATVTYIKRKGRGVYRFRASSSGEYKNVSRKQLERTLLKLKNKHGIDLYVKVIIPENSGLSYNEAWKFTNFIQKSYDYYFQNKSSE